jgi:hypothetical protein
MKYDKPEQSTKDEIPCRVYFVGGDVGKLKKLRVRDEWDDFFGYARPLTDWLGVKTYSNPADLVQVEIDPENPEVYEGQDFKFTGKITPKEGLGTGEFTATTKTLDLLDGYQAQKLESLIWNSKILPDEQAWKNSQGFTFDFKPKDGTGTYEVIASTLVEIKEKDTAAQAKATGVSSTTAIVKPGLKFLSPIDRFAYPESVAIQVITSMDNAQEDWEKIEWSIDGKPWIHGVSAPPISFTPDKPGKFVLKAVYTQSPKPPLTAIAEFEVKPVSISILPWRRVTEFIASSSLPMQIHAVFNQQTVPKPGVWFKWSEDGSVQAQIEKVEWQAFFNSSGSSELKPLPHSLEAEVLFGSFGAVTALATVTLQVQGKMGRLFTYSFSANRGDLWVIPKASEYEVKGHFPEIALAEACRTYVATYACFNLAENSYTWTPEGLSKEIVFSPALPGVSDAIGKTMVLKWKDPAGESSEGTSHVMAPIIPGNYQVRLQIEADFGNSNLVPIIRSTWPVQVFPVSKYISPSVKPASFSITIGGSQLLEFLISPIKNRAEKLPICQNAFTASPQDVEWFKGEDFYKKGNPISFEGNQISSGTITAHGTVFVQETYSQPAPGGVASFAVNTKFEVNPLPLTHIVVRRKDSVEASNHYEVGFRKETNQFQAIGFSGESEIGPIEADWEMIGGEATASLQIGILKAQQVPESCRIATINGKYSVSGFPKVTMVSYLPGSFSLNVSKGAISTVVSFRVKQPTLWLSVKAVKGVGPLAQLSDWISETKEIWLQQNNFLNIKVRHGEYDDENFPWIENASFADFEPNSSEIFFKDVTNGLWLLYPLSADIALSGSNNGKNVVPRLSRELLGKKRSEILPQGSPKDLNIYIVNQTYWSAPLPGYPPYDFKKAGGISISRDEYFNLGGLSQINDFSSSGVILSHDAMIQPNSRYYRDMAHEIGHHLIQQGLYQDNSDEHIYNNPKNIMFPSPDKGAEINASQALMVLDYDTKKPETSYFIVEE